MSNIIDKIQVSGVTYDIQGSGGGGITVDPTLDSGSTNPVANSAITTALDAKVNVADNEVSGLTIAETAFYGVRYDYGRITDLYFKLANENITGNGTFYLYYHTSSSSNSWFGVSWAGIEGVLTSATVTKPTAVTATLEDGICHLSFNKGYSFSYIWKDYTETFDFWFYTDYNGGQSARVIEGSVSQAISDSYKEIKNVLHAKVNVADNAVPTKTIMYAYDKGDSAWKSPYNQGLRINQFFVKYTQSFESSNVPAWNNPMYITNDGSTTSEIYLRVNASNYQITSVVGTSGDFTYALDDGRVNVTLPDGYYISSFAQKYSFQILYPKYVINGGQSAQALQNTENVLNDIYSEMPKRWITGGSISCSSTNINTYLYDNNGNSNNSSIELGTSIKGDGNRLDVYFDGQTIHQKILNTGSGNYCDVPNSPAWNYTDNLDEVIIHFNSGYTGSNTSYTIQVQTINPNTYTYSDNLYYDVANHTLDASSATHVTATTVGNDYTYSIRPKQEYFNYRIVRIRENNYCNIAGVNQLYKEEFIITGVTTPSYSYQAQEIIDDLYSKVGGGKAIEGGRGISITTGETADTVSFNLPISAGTGTASIIEGQGTVASGNYGSHAEGIGTTASGNYGSHAEGYNTNASGYSSHAEGFETLASGDYSHAEGQDTIANNNTEHASGQYNVSNNASATFGDSGNTLFSVGNGTGNNARHNAFEIRQNGDIYLSSGGTDIKLQDHLGGGGSVTVDTELDSGSTNPVENRVIYNKIDEVEEVTAAALNNINDRLTEDEEVTAAGLNALNDNFGGLKLVKLTEAEYNALATKDSSTLYVIVD